jgi:hypothetical protein
MSVKKKKRISAHLLAERGRQSRRFGTTFNPVSLFENRKRGELGAIKGYMRFRIRQRLFPVQERVEEWLFLFSRLELAAAHVSKLVGRFTLILKDWRIITGLSPQEAAVRLAVPEEVFRRWERGEWTISDSAYFPPVTAARSQRHRS